MFVSEWCRTGVLGVLGVLGVMVSGLGGCGSCGSPKGEPQAEPQAETSPPTLFQGKDGGAFSPGVGPHAPWRLRGPDGGLRFRVHDASASPHQPPPSPAQ
jgi:hypothetical protein